MAPRRRAAYRCVYPMRNVSSPRRAVLLLALVTGFPQVALAQHACAEQQLVAPPAGGWSAPLDTRVSLHLRDVSLRDGLDRLTAASKVQLAYSADFLPVDRRVCLSADGEPLGSLLASLLRGTPVQVLVVSGRVVLSPGATQAPSAEPASRSVSVLERVVVTGNAVIPVPLDKLVAPNPAHKKGPKNNDGLMRPDDLYLLHR